LTIILSSVWGQTDSVISYLSIIAFILLFNKKFIISALIFSIGLLFKPNWVVFIPLYLIIFFINHPKFKTLIFSAISVLILLLIVSYPFSDHPVSFYLWLLKERIIPTIGASKVASVSAFNFYTTFLRIDYHLSSFKILSLSVKDIGQLIFFIIYSFIAVILIKKKVDSMDILKAIFAIGLGSFLFMPGMLDRYFFPAIIPLAILAISKKKMLAIYLTLSVSFTLNVIWALFRRKYGGIDNLLTENNFLLLRILSFYNLFAYLFTLWLLFRDNLIKLSLWKKQANILTRQLK
jgi:Gpi18-like mannosyltransferase